MDRAAGVVPRPSYLACYNVPKVGQPKLAGIQKAKLRAVPTLAELFSFRRPLVCRVELHGASSSFGSKNGMYGGGASDPSRKASRNASAASWLGFEISPILYEALLALVAA